MKLSTRVIRAARDLCEDVDALAFAEPVTHVYNPLRYAQKPHEKYLSAFADSPKKVLFLGMNPGPFGMSQTGVPFGEVAAARDWLRITGRVGRPDPEHPKRPVEGFDCTRSEVSGRRLWALFADRFGKPEKFFADHFVVNYCPLVFLEESGRNRTPDKLPLEERVALGRVCDRHLRKVVELMEPEWLVGIGNYAEKRLKDVVGETNGTRIGRVLHPSPASPLANRGWAEAATKQLEEQGIW